MTGDGLLLTRLLPPRQPADCLDRPALASRIATGLEGRLVTVLAGAGYGKSTALVQALAECPHPSVWVSCDERLGGAPDLLSHITAGLARMTPGFGTRIAFDGPVSRQAATLINELVATLPDDVVLVLDDVHLLDVEATEAVACLVRDLPPSVHLALVGRAPLPFPLGKVRAGGLLAIGEADLALDDREIAALWGGADAAVIDDLRARTEGWVAGVVLASQLGAERLGAVGHESLFDYLGEEVLTALPTELQELLLWTAPLERFSPALAGRVAGVDAAQHCRDLVARHLFTIRLEDEGEWYRYHHLFRDFLRHRLAETGPERVAEAHRRAADAWIAAGDPFQAVDHLLSAGEPERAADIMESLADGMWLGAQSQVLVRWMGALPDAAYSGRPALTLARALMAFAKGDAHRGFELLDPCIEDFLAAGDHERAAAAFFALIYAQLSGGTRQAYAIDVGYRQLPRIDMSAKLLPASVVMMACELGCATRYDEAERMLGSLLEMRLPRVDPLAQGYLASARALFLDHPRGRSAQALSTIDWVIELFERHEQHDELAYAIALRCYRAILLNHLGRYDDALDEFDRMMAGAVRRGITGGADRALLKVRAVALAGLERWDELEALLADGEPVDDMRGSSYGFRIRAPAARLAEHRGDRDGVARHVGVVMDYVEAFGFSFDTPAWICDIAATAWRMGLHDDARRLLNEVLTGAERAQSPWSRTRGLLLRSVIEKDTGGADAALAEALALTDEWGFEEIWTRRDRAMAATTLARAIARGLGPDGLAVGLAVRAGAEVLDACAEALSAAPADARARLVAGLDAAGLEDPALRDRLGRGRTRPRAGTAAGVARPPLRIEGLGGFTVRRGGEAIPVAAFGRERARAVLAALVCAGGPVHREQLLDWLWPDLDPQRGLRALHVTLHGLRRALEPQLGRGGTAHSVIRSEGEGYRLAPADGDATDLEEFLALARPAGGESPQARIRRLSAAELAYGGPLYPEWPYAAWAEERRRDAERTFTAVLADLADAHLEAGRHREALLRYERLVALEPEREAVHRNLMLAYARSGEKALALRQYHACRSTLRRELGVEASAETRSLYQRILEDRPVEEPAITAAA